MITALVSMGNKTVMRTELRASKKSNQVGDLMDITHAVGSGTRKRLA